MNEIRTEVLIDAPKEIIWGVLTDFPSYSTWNPFIVRIVGSPRLGAMIGFVAAMNGMKVPIIARLISFEKNLRLSWGGPAYRWVRKVVEVEHYFIIEEVSATQCRFINGETMAGLVPDLLWAQIERGRPAYEAMNVALKERAEQQHAQA